MAAGRPTTNGVVTADESTPPRWPRCVLKSIIVMRFEVIAWQAAPISILSNADHSYRFIRLADGFKSGDATATMQIAMATGTGATSVDTSPVANNHAAG